MSSARATLQIRALPEPHGVARAGGVSTSISTSKASATNACRMGKGRGELGVAPARVYSHDNDGTC